MQEYYVVPYHVCTCKARIGQCMNIIIIRALLCIICLHNLFHTEVIEVLSPNETPAGNQFSSSSLDSGAGYLCSELLFV